MFPTETALWILDILLLNWIKLLLKWDILSVGQMSPHALIGQMSVGQVSVDQMSVGQVSVHQVSVGQVSVDQVSVAQVSGYHPNYTIWMGHFHVLISWMLCGRLSDIPFTNCWILISPFLFPLWVSYYVISRDTFQRGKESDKFYNFIIFDNFSLNTGSRIFMENNMGNRKTKFPWSNHRLKGELFYYNKCMGNQQRLFREREKKKLRRSISAHIPNTQGVLTSIDLYNMRNRENFFREKKKVTISTDLMDNH